jgi:hypothetical protein
VEEGLFRSMHGPGQMTKLKGKEDMKFKQRAFHSGQEYENYLIAKIDKTSNEEGVYLGEDGIGLPGKQDFSGFEGDESPDRSFYKEKPEDEGASLISSTQRGGKLIKKAPKDIQSNGLRGRSPVWKNKKNNPTPRKPETFAK